MKIEIKVPAVGESITEATISEWTKKNGEKVQRDDILLVLETDKASVEVVAEQAGVLSTQAQEGETVQIGAVIGTIDNEASPSSTADTPANTNGSAQSPQGQSQNESKDLSLSSPSKVSSEAPPLSPAVRKLVSENKIDPATLTPGSGKGGRITKGDVLASLETKTSPTSAAQTTASSEQTPSAHQSSELSFLQTKTSLSSSREIKKVPMSKLRQTVARRLVEAQHTAAILTTFNEIDMSAVMALRSKYKDSFKEKHGVGLGFMGFFVKATVAALK
ncbi:MAG: E3 binding domain-containing protein, partial [Bdellovibrionales bacterium]|nr:E3 binding domain-containing protein [Bdellovibrionales bacterium]